jgi:hypothetical protein
MKQFIVFVCVAMAAALAWSNRTEIAAFAERQGFAPQPRVQYVESGPATVGGGPEAYLAGATDGTDWEQRYLFLRHNGMWASGVRDVDEAVSASVHLRDHPGRWYPQRWRSRLTAGKKWVEEMNGDGEDEEFCGASEATPPAWVGKPAGMRARDETQGVPTGTALRRFFCGVREDERL